ncbi:unnamed protein product [Toxocara canis]|uniref:VWFA domain-containing protein n=1 Tax=Toxocara canis TaxID=6265 RepID=A0A183TXT2_TOXCA|nr:unnamed protein product [Toxocara canis]
MVFEIDHAIDLILVLDKSTSMVDDFDSAKNFAEELVESAPAGDYVSRIRVALVTFNDKAHLDFGLKKFTSRDDILFALERAENSGGETSAVSGLNVATGEIKANRRNASRLIVVLLSDGGSKDAWELVNATAKRLHDTDAEVFGVTMTDRYFREELLVFTGNPGHLFVRMKGKEQEFAASVDLKKCGGNGELKHDNIIDRADSEGGGPTRLPKPTLGDSNEIADIKRKPDAGVEKLPVIKDISTETSAPERSIANSTRVPISIDSNCRVDLMFIIDRSESVEREFQKQLQFAVDLVKRMSSADFGSRVRVAAVSFYSKAQLEFPFGKFKEQSKILDALLQIEHVGGSTSAVSGVNLAVDEIQKTGRNDARRMIVLISDGNSQDMWDKVLEAAGRLREIDADVYAVTVSHDYYFRELELYAGNKWLVYIDARIRQFLDEAEKSVAQCRGPLIAASTPPREKPNTTPLPHRADLKETTVPERTTDDVTFASPEESQSCRQDPVDVVIILDTSTSVEKDFYAEKQFALDLVKVFPEEHFVERISVALVQFAGSAKLQFGFGEQKTRGDVLYEMERVEHTGGQTSLVSGANEAIKQIKANHRPNARLVTVFVTDGNSQDLWHIVQETAKKLRETGGEVYAVTLSPKYYFDELKEYAGSEDHVYIDDRIHKFIKEVGASVVTCAGEKQAKVTLPPTEEVRITSPTVATSGPLVTKSSEKSVEKSNEKVDEKRKGTPKDAVIQSFDKSDFAKDDTPVVATRELQSPKTINKK